MLSYQHPALLGHCSYIYWEIFHLNNLIVITITDAPQTWCKYTHCCRYNKTKTQPNIQTNCKYSIYSASWTCVLSVCMFFLSCSALSSKFSYEKYLMIISLSFEWFAHLIAVTQENMVNNKFLFKYVTNLYVDFSLSAGAAAYATLASRNCHSPVKALVGLSDRSYLLYSILNSPFSPGALPPSGGVQRTLEGWKRHILKRVCLRPVYINVQRWDKLKLAKRMWSASEQ